MIANQVRQNLAALMDMANRQDGNGEYLFAGTSTATQPFAQGAAGVNYQGDQTTRQIRISSTQSLADVHTGVDAFMGIAERNGVFRTTVAATNTGNATIDVGTVTDLTRLGARQLHAAIHQRHRLAGGRRQHADARDRSRRARDSPRGRASASWA